MARNDPQVNLRIPASLKARIDEAAELNVRSMNAEIVSRLEMTFNAQGRITPAEMINALIKSFPPGMIEIRIGKVEAPEFVIVRAPSENDSSE